MPFAPERIAVLVPTRNRPDDLRRLHANLSTTCLRPEWVALWVFADPADEATASVLQELGELGGPLAIRPFLEADPDTHGARYNRMWQQGAGQADVYLIASDKSLLRTPAWDEVIRQAHRGGDGYGFFFLRDSVNQGRFGAFPVLAEPWAQALGALMTEHFPFWFDDTWLNDVAQLVGRWRPLPIEMEMVTGPTQRMFQLRFWDHFYEACQGDRLAQAKALLACMHPDDPEALASAVAQAELLVAHSRRSEAQWAGRHEQLLGLEENFAARRLGPQPLPPPEDSYWRVEARAVALLQAKLAQAEAQGAAAEAQALRTALSYSEGAHQEALKALEAALQAGGLGALATWQAHLERFPFRPEGFALTWAHLQSTGQREALASLGAFARQRFPQWGPWQGA